MRIIHRIGDTEIYKINDGIYGLLTKSKYQEFSDILELLEVDKEDVSDDNIKIKAKSIKTLKTYLSENHNVVDYNMAVKITLDIVRQILYLEELDLTYSFITINDIIVIDDNKFLILNQNNIYKINKNYLEINKPYDKSSFMSLKLKENTELPFKVYFTEVYYSVGSILVYCLFNKEISEELDLRMVLRSIFATRLYWFIVKSLRKDPLKRKLIFF